MQTAAIPYRLADFLKQHPPFQWMHEPDLLALAARGRVKFHEQDEYICWQSSPHTPFIYVIQQGSISLWDETANPPALCDVRGPGDCIGLERFNGAVVSLQSAKANGEVLLYALDAADFESALARNPPAARYVAAYSAVTADYRVPDERARPHEISLADLVREGASVEHPASMSIREAARFLSESSTQALALSDGKTTSLLTSADLLRWIAAGAVRPEQPAWGISCAPDVKVDSHTLLSDCILAMAESRASAAALTGKSSAASEGVVTAAVLEPAFGDHPLAILQEIDAAPGVPSLRQLNLRARAWILANLDVPSAFDWLARWADFVNRRIVERLIGITAGHDSGRLYCFYGAAGRQELLTFVAPRLAVIGGSSGGLETALVDCGYLFPEPSVCAELDEWKTRFSGWINDPIRTQVYQSRQFFDLRLIEGPRQTFRELESHIRAEIAAAPAFLRVIANDCLSSLPPLTFFRDLVVEESGERNDIFRLEKSALQPLADVARVFGLALGAPLGVSTRERLHQAARLLPDHKAIFQDAAETTRLLLFQQARAGLRFRSNGAELPLSVLSRQDRQVLKTGFRAIHNLLEFAAPGEWLDTL